MSYDKRKLLSDICDLHLARESMYGHLPDVAHDSGIVCASRSMAGDVLRIIAFGASLRTREEDVALIGGICDDMLFALQESVRALP